MNKILLLLLFIIPLSLFGQVESQFNGTLNVFSASRIGMTHTFTISGIFSSTTTSYTSANSAIGDIIQVQSGSRFYWMHIYSIASNSGGVITCNVRDSSSTLTAFPSGKWSIFRPTSNLRLPLSPDGETNASRSATFNTLALRVDEIQTSVASATNCERTITKSNHGFRKWTPVYWTGANYVRPPYDSLVPDYIVVDSLTANTFKVASCGTYATVLPDGLYWFTNQSPGYSLTPDTTKAPLFQVIDSVLVLNPIVGFNLLAVEGIQTALADTAAAIRADFPTPDGNGIISALPTGDVIIQSSNDLYIKDGSTGFHKTSYKTSTGATGTEIYRGGIIINKTATSDFGASYNIKDTTGVVDFTYATTQDDRGVIQNQGSGPQITNLLVSTKLPGTYRWPYGVRVDTSSTISVIRQMYGDRYAGPTTPNVHHFRGAVPNSATAYSAPFRLETNSASGKLSADIDGSLFVRENGKVYIGADSLWSFSGGSSLLNSPTTANSTYYKIFTELRQKWPGNSSKWVSISDFYEARASVAHLGLPTWYKLIQYNGGVNYEWGNGIAVDSTNNVFHYTLGGRYSPSILNFNISRPSSGTTYQTTPGLTIGYNPGNGLSTSDIVRIYSTVNNIASFFNIRQDGRITFGNNDNNNSYYFPITGPSSTSGALSSLLWTSGTPSFLRSQHGVATGTTDGSGDLTITFAAAMPDITYAIQVQPEGTTSYTTSVHTKATGTCKVRFFNPATGAAVTATSVTISYEAKDY